MVRYSIKWFLPKTAMPLMETLEKTKKYERIGFILNKQL